MRRNQGCNNECNNECSDRDPCDSCCRRGRRGPRGHTGPAGTAPSTQLSYSANQVGFFTNVTNLPQRFLTVLAFEATLQPIITGTQVGGAIEVVENGDTSAFRATRSGTLRNLKFGVFTGPVVIGYEPPFVLRVSVFVANAPASISPPTYVESSLRAEYKFTGVALPAGSFIQGEDTVHAVNVVDGQYILVAVYIEGPTGSEGSVGSIRAGLQFH